MKNNSGWISLGLIHLVFFCLALSLGNIHLKDSLEYLQQASNIRSHGSWYCGNLLLPIEPPLYSQRPPLYGLFLSITNWLSIGEWFPLLIQNMLSFYNCILALWLFEVITEKKISSIKLLWPMLFFASQFIYANMIMSEVLFQTSWILATYFAIKFLKDFKPIHLIFHQVSITAALLIKPIAYAFPILSTLGLIILVMQKKIPSKIISTALIPLSGIVIILCVNYYHTSVVEFSSIQRKLMINYNIPQLLSKKMDDKSAIAKVDSVQQLAGTLSYPDQTKFIDQQCLHFIAQSPITYLSLHLKGVFRFFLDHGRWDLYTFFTGVNLDQNTITTLQKSFDSGGISSATSYIISFPKAIVAYLLLVFIMNLLLFIYFMRFLFNKYISKSIRIALALMVFYLAILTGPTGSARFRVPIYPILLVSFAITSISDQKRIARSLKL